MVGGTCARCTVGGVELVDDKLHMALTYVDTIERTGTPLTIEAFDGFAVHPTPVPWRQRSSYLAAMRDEMLSEYYYEPGESPSAFLLRSQWIRLVGGSVRLTNLGKAVLRHAQRPQLQSGIEGPLTVTIDPDDPLAYLRVFDLLGGAGAGLLVDPYIRFEELFDLAELTRVDRVLTSNRVDRTGLRLKQLSRTLAQAEMTVELRVLAPEHLHDRFYIPDTGDIYLLGSSLNSITARPGVIAPIADHTGSEALRDAYTKLWRSADVLPPSSRDTAAGSTPA